MAQCAVFASGRGSNFIAIHEYLASRGKGHSIRWLVSDKESCGAVAYARQAGIEVILLAYRGRDKAEVEAELNRRLMEAPPALLVLAGFMRLLGPTLVDAWPGRIINIHPSLLPRHPGAHGIRDSWESGDPELGITIHQVDHGMDTGPIIVQESFVRKVDDDLESIEAKIHALEHSLYPAVVADFLDRHDAGKETA